MKRIMSLILALALLAGCVTVFASCGEPKDAGAEISVYLGEEIYDFDPTDYYVDSNADQIMSLLFEPLFTLSKSGKLKKNGLAKDYKVDKDERTIVIELRESYWSDEIRVTAEDFVYSWRDILLEPINSNPAAALLYDIENAVEIKNGEKTIYELGVEASDTYELTITYRDGANYKQLLKNLASVATSPVRQDIATDFTVDYWTKVINTAVTNGPFKLEELDYTLGTFTLSRNIGYHQKPTAKKYTKQVTASQLVSFTNPDGSAMNVKYSDIENKTVFYMSDAPLEERASNKDEAKVLDDLSTYTYVFNTENPLFAIKEVRQALSMAIDRNAIVNAITFGKAATGFIPDACIDAATKDPFREHADLISKGAKLDEAKTILAGVDFGTLSKSFTLTVNDDAESLAIAAIVEAAWESLGFDVTVEAVGVVNTKVKDFVNNEDLTISDSAIQYAVKEASRGKREFDVIAVDWQMYSTDPFVALSAFATRYSGCGRLLGDGVNTALGSFGGYVSEEYNTLIDKAFKATDKDERSEFLRQAEKVLMDSACIVPLVFNQNFAFVSKELSKVKNDGFGNFVLTKTKQKNYEDYLD